MRYKVGLSCLSLGIIFLTSGLLLSGCVQTSSSSDEGITYERVLKDVYAEAKTDCAYYYVWLYFGNGSSQLIYTWHGDDHVIPLYLLAKENIGNKVRYVMKGHDCTWFECIERNVQ